MVLLIKRIINMKYLGTVPGSLWLLLLIPCTCVDSRPLSLIVVTWMKEERPEQSELSTLTPMPEQRGHRKHNCKDLSSGWVTISTWWVTANDALSHGGDTWVSHGSTGSQTSTLKTPCCETSSTCPQHPSGPSTLQSQGVMPDSTSLELSLACSSWR